MWFVVAPCLAQGQVLLFPVLWHTTGTCAEMPCHCPNGFTPIALGPKSAASTAATALRSSRLGGLPASSLGWDFNSRCGLFGMPHFQGPIPRSIWPPDVFSIACVHPSSCPGVRSGAAHSLASWAPSFGAGSMWIP